MRRAALGLLIVLASCSGNETGETPIAADSGAIDTATTTESDTNVAEETAPLIDSTSPMDAVADAISFGPYPSAPYGNKVGEVVANLALEGYVSPLADDLANKRPYVTTSMDQLRRDAKKGYALIHVSEFY